MTPIDKLETGRARTLGVVSSTTLGEHCAQDLTVLGSSDKI